MCRALGVLALASVVVLGACTTDRISAPPLPSEMTTTTVAPEGLQSHLPRVDDSQVTLIYNPSAPEWDGWIIDAIKWIARRHPVIGSFATYVDRSIERLQCLYDRDLLAVGLYVRAPATPVGIAIAYRGNRRSLLTSLLGCGDGGGGSTAPEPPTEEPDLDGEPAMPDGFRVCTETLSAVDEQGEAITVLGAGLTTTICEALKD